MLSVTESENSAAAAHYYDTGKAQNDYFLAAQEVASEWWGKGCKRMGLEGPVTAEDYKALCYNKDPRTGKPLTPRTREARRPGYDITVSASKSESVMHALFGKDDVYANFRVSGEWMMENLVEPEMRTRVRRAGKDEDRLTGEVICARHGHLTARPVNRKPDMHIHDHWYVFNATYDPVEGRMKAGQFGEIKTRAPDIELEFDAYRAIRLREMGYVPVMSASGHGFELAGVPQSVIDKFSMRRNEVEADAAELGITDAKGKHRITRQNRERKRPDLSAGDLLKDWNSRLTNEEREALRRVAYRQIPAGRNITAEEAVQWAIRHQLESADVVSERQIRKTAVYYGIGYLTPDRVQQEIERLAALGDIIVAEENGRRDITSRQRLMEQIAMLKFAREGRGQSVPFGLDAKQIAGLHGEQRAAAAQILTCPDRIMGIRGAAGAGKTTLLKHLVPAIEQGFQNPAKVMLVAQSSSASRGTLRGAGFRNADTLETLLRSKELQDGLRNGVIIADEASQIGGEDMRRLFTVVKELNARLILVGDYKQHGSVKAGDAFRLLESEAGLKYARLRTIVRQKSNPGYLRAVEAIEKGTAEDVRKGFDLLDAMGSIVEVDRSKGQRVESMLIGDYLNAVKDGKTALIVAPTHAQKDRVTGSLRNALKEYGRLGTEERTITVRRSLNWTEAQRGDMRRYQPGMVVEFYQSVPGTRQRVGGSRITVGGFKRGECAVVSEVGDGKVSLLRQNGETVFLPASPERFQVFAPRQMMVAIGERLRLTQNGVIATSAGGKVSVNNGDILTVEGFTKAGDLLVDGSRVLPRTYAHVDLGYVDTSFSSQGKTVSRVLIAAGSSAMPAVNAQQWYVSVSRGQEMCKVYVDSKQEVRNAIGRSGERTGAVELARKSAEARKHGHRAPTKELLDRHRATRYLKNRAQALVDS